MLRWAPKTLWTHLFSIYTHITSGFSRRAPRHCTYRKVLRDAHLLTVLAIQYACNGDSYLCLGESCTLTADYAARTSHANPKLGRSRSPTMFNILLVVISLCRTNTFSSLGPSRPDAQQRIDRGDVVTCVTCALASTLAHATQSTR